MDPIVVHCVQKMLVEIPKKTELDDGSASYPEEQVAIKTAEVLPRMEAPTLQKPLTPFTLADLSGAEEDNAGRRARNSNNDA